MLGGLRPLGGACARDGIPNTSTSGSGSAPLCCELMTTAGALLFGSCETMTDRKAFPAATARRAVSHLLASLGMPIFLNVLAFWLVRRRRVGDVLLSSFFSHFGFP